MKRYFICTLYVIIGLTLEVSAQNMTNLPTSMYGVGELSSGDGGRYAGMGQIGIALGKKGYLNTQNPAALTALDTIGFNFDIGLTAKYTQYSYLSERSTSTMGEPNRFGLAARLTKRWYAMIGASPYSNTGYLIQTKEPIEGTEDGYVYSNFTGEGGLYRCYLSNGLILFNGLSIGASIGVLLGNVTQSEVQENAILEYETSRCGLYTDFGLYYDYSTFNNKGFSIGLTFSPSTQLSQTKKLVYSNSSSSEGDVEDLYIPKQYLPMKIGAGFTVSFNKWLLTADYNFMDWSRNKSASSSMKYENQHKFNVGGIFSLHPRKARSIEFMCGAGYYNSYLKMKNEQMNYLDINGGISIPVQASYLSVGISWHKQMNHTSGLMQETSWNLHFNFTLGERIWGKRKIN